MIILIHISTPAFRMDSVSLKNTEATPNECISVWTAIYILWITMGNFYTNIGLFWTFVKAGKSCEISTSMARHYTKNRSTYNGFKAVSTWQPHQWKLSPVSDKLYTYLVCSLNKLFQSTPPIHRGIVFPGGTIHNAPQLVKI